MLLKSIPLLPAKKSKQSAVSLPPPSTSSAFFTSFDLNEKHAPPAVVAPLPPPPPSFTTSPKLHNLDLTNNNFNASPADTITNSPDPQSISKKTCRKKYSLSEKHHSLNLTNQLQQMERYWTQPNNLQRKEAAVNQVTHKKRRERILCFMGWCRESNQVAAPDLLLYNIDASQENRERYETYLDYLKRTRWLNDGTVVEHITAAIYALKFLFAR